MEKQVQRNYKDTVFRMIFAEPENALSLYNSLHGTNYDNPKDLEFNTLENAIYMNIKNDLSFLIAHQMNLYEQQSTYTPNMPLRILFYVSDVLQNYIKDKLIYGSKLINLPTPHFVVFYNGLEELPERMGLRLSEAFKQQTDNPELELKVTLLNICYEKNEEIKQRCHVLKEYMTYVELVRTYAKSMELSIAVEKAVDECIRNNVLKDFLLKQKAEVVKVSIYEYDEEKAMRLMREEAEEIGWEKGREEAFKMIISLCIEYGESREMARNRLVEKCGLSQEEAEERVSRYWQED